MSKKKVIGIVGLPASGKSTAIKAVEDMGKVITMGDVIRKETLNRGLEINSANLGDTALKLRKEFGETIIAVKCSELIKNLEEKVIFIDGIRSMKEVVYFQKFWEFPILAILCTDEIRYQRLKERGRADDSKNFQDIVERDKRERGFGLDQVIKNAKYSVNNDDNIEILKQRTRDAIKRILSE